MSKPILWTFRRCPYAMRARLAIASAGIDCELREILLRDKPKKFLETSPKGTVPVLDMHSVVIDESLDVMKFALEKNDPDGWLEMPAKGHDLIAEVDGPFKTALDRYKYTSRYKDAATEVEREKAAVTLRKFNDVLATSKYFMGDRITLADMATVTFVRQYANTDRAWFDSQPWPHLIRWLEEFLNSDRFKAIMIKYPPWQPSDAPTPFP